VYNLPSKLFESAVSELSRLPGIGRKSAMRMALYLLRCTPGQVESFGEAILRMRRDILFCTECGNISDIPVCEICGNPKRDHGLICVVEDVRDVMAIENTGQYSGLYHILGGIISPMEGIGPQDLFIEKLLERAGGEEVREVILALPATIEGDTTNYFLYKKLKNLTLSVSVIARGVSVGDELEHTDEVTLGRSILQRTPFERSVSGG